MSDVSEISLYEENVLTVSGELDPAHSYTELRLASGETLCLPTALLLQRSVDSRKPSLDPLEDSEISIPVIEESLEVSKRVVETGKVRLHKTVQEYPAALNETLAVRTFDVERVVLNQPVERAPQVRHEGDTTIYSVVEEQLVLTKQLILREEVRVTQRDTERTDTQVVMLRREQLDVERVPTIQE